jgi:hypothetical protein
MEEIQTQTNKNDDDDNDDDDSTSSSSSESTIEDNAGDSSQTIAQQLDEAQQLDSIEITHPDGNRQRIRATSWPRMMTTITTATTTRTTRRRIACSVRNLPFLTTEEDLHELFGTFGTIEECHIPVDDQKRNKGFAFVTYTKADSAARAKDTLDGTDFQGRYLHMSTGTKEVVPQHRTNYPWMIQNLPTNKDRSCCEKSILRQRDGLQVSSVEMLSWTIWQPVWGCARGTLWTSKMANQETLLFEWLWGDTNYRGESSILFYSWD